jgi:hypothetical protein
MPVIFVGFKRKKQAVAETCDDAGVTCILDQMDKIYRLGRTLYPNLDRLEELARLQRETEEIRARNSNSERR